MAPGNPGPRKRTVPDPALRTRPTLLGWILLGLAGILCSTVLWQEQPLAMYLGLLFALALLGSYHLARRDIARVGGRWLLPGTCHAGEPVTVGSMVAADRPASALGILCFDPMRGRMREACRLPGVSESPTRMAWNVRFPERGLISLPPLYCRSSFPFGLLSTARPYSEATELVVFPSLGTVREGFSLMLRRWQDLGTNANRNGADEFSHLRNYRPGDSPRRIHWRASAKHRALMVSERQDPELQCLSIYVDTRCRLRFSRRMERLIACAATIVHHLLARQWQVRLYGPFTDAHGLVGNSGQLLAALALAEHARPDDFHLDLAPGEQCLLLTLDPDKVPLADTPGCRVVDLAEAERLVALGRMPR